MATAKTWYDKARGYPAATARPFKIEAEHMRGSNSRATHYHFRDGSRLVIYHADRKTPAHAIAWGYSDGYLMAVQMFPSAPPCDNCGNVHMTGDKCAACGYNHGRLD